MPLPWVGLPSTSSGCSGSHPTWPWMLLEMGYLHLSGQPVPTTSCKWIVLATNTQQNISKTWEKTFANFCDSHLLQYTSLPSNRFEAHLNVCQSIWEKTTAALCNVWWAGPCTASSSRRCSAGTQPQRSTQESLSHSMVEDLPKSASLQNISGKSKAKQNFVDACLKNSHISQKTTRKRQ